MSWNLLPSFLSRISTPIKISDDDFTNALVDVRQTAKMPENMNLENCPFCGGSAMEITSINKNANVVSYTTHIECLTCRAESDKVLFDSKSDPYKELETKWNSRPNKEKELQKKLDELIAENFYMRKILAFSTADCIYCKRQYHEMDGCSSCRRARDMI